MSEYLGIMPNSSEKYFFLSYSNSDADRIKDLGILNIMNENKIPIWYDYGLEYGGLWETQISNRIRESQALITIITKNVLSKKSDTYIRKEYDIGDFYDKNNIFIILDEINNEDIPDRNVTWWLEINKRHCIFSYKYKTIHDVIKELKRVEIISHNTNFKQKDPSNTKRSFIHTELNIKALNFINKLRGIYIKMMTEHRKSELSNNIKDNPTLAFSGEYFKDELLSLFEEALLTEMTSNYNVKDYIKIIKPIFDKFYEIKRDIQTNTGENDYFTQEIINSSPEKFNNDYINKKYDLNKIAFLSMKSDQIKRQHIHIFLDYITAYQKEILNI